MLFLFVMCIKLEQAGFSWFELAPANQVGTDQWSKVDADVRHQAPGLENCIITEKTS